MCQNVPLAAKTRVSPAICACWFSPGEAVFRVVRVLRALPRGAGKTTDHDEPYIHDEPHMDESKSDPNLGLAASSAPDTTLPDSFRVGVLMERRDRPDSRWLRESWHLLGVVLEAEPAAGDGRRCIRQSDDGEQYLWSGFRARLHRDELESYYHNLLSPEPKIFVIAHSGADGAPEPFLVSLSYDEADAYESGGDQIVYSAALPPVLYSWVEQYVLENYAPERRIKRKRDHPGKGGVCE